MNYKTTKLSNGLTVIIEPNPNIETVIVLLSFRGGSAFEGNNIGAAHFFEHIVFDGTTNFPSKRDLTEIIENVGASKNGRTGKEQVYYFVEGQPKHLGQMCQYLSEITIRPLMREEDVYKEKRVINKEIKQFIDNPAKYSSLRLMSLLYPDQSFGRYTTGDLEDLVKLNSEFLWDFWKKHYVAENGVLVVRGNIDDSVINQLEQYFGAMSSGVAQKLPIGNASLENVVWVENRLGMAQCHFRLSFPSFLQDDSRVYSMAVLGTILTRGITSRLIYRLREEEGLIYGLGNGTFHYATASYAAWGTGTGIDEASLNRTLTIIKEELAKVCQDKVSETELRRGANYCAVGMVIGTQKNEDRAISYAHDQLFRGRIRDIPEEIAHYEAVTTEDVLKVAQQLVMGGSKLFVLAPTLNKEDIVF